MRVIVSGGRDFLNVSAVAWGLPVWKPIRDTSGELYPLPEISIIKSS